MCDHTSSREPLIESVKEKRAHIKNAETARTQKRNAEEKNKSISKPRKLNYQQRLYQKYGHLNENKAYKKSA